MTERSRLRQKAVLKKSFMYQCSLCRQTYEISPEIMLCASCQKKQQPGQPLMGILDVIEVNPSQKTHDTRHLNWLPVPSSFFPSIPVGNTPLWRPAVLRKRVGFSHVYIKDEGANPSGSLKDRASFLVAAFAKEHGIEEIVLASTGNAGSSMACLGAASQIRVMLFLPKTAPRAKMVQALQYGARVILVDGSYDEAYELSLQYSQSRQLLSRNTAYNPLTIEGKKTVSFEIFEQLNRNPDHVFVPAGDGVILSALYKGFKDLKSRKMIGQIPTVWAVQAKGSDAIVRAFHDQGKFVCKKASTIADSICVEIPRNGLHALNNLKQHHGRALKVTDQEILEGQRELAAYAGLFAEPAAAAAYAGFLKAKDQIAPGDHIVILSTGHGLKDLPAATHKIQIPKKSIKSIAEIQD